MLMLLVFSSCSNNKENGVGKSELIGTWFSQEEGTVTFCEDELAFGMEKEHLLIGMA